MVDNISNEPEEKQINYRLNFFILAAGQLVSAVGTSVFNFALSLYVLDISGSAFAFSTVLTLGMVPKILINLFAGVFVDRHNKKKIIVISDLLSGASILFFALLMNIYSASLIVVIASNMLLGVFNALFQLGIMASIPNIVHEDAVLRANSTMQSITAITNMVGPVLGALLYNGFGIKFVFLANGISFLLSGISEAFLVFKRKKEEQTHISYLEDFKEGLKYIKKQKVIRFLLVFAVFINAIGYPLILLVMPYITYKVLKVTSFQLSLIEASWAIGVVVGALLLSVMRSQKPIMRRFFILLETQSVLITLWFFPKIPFFSALPKWTLTLIFCVMISVLAFLFILLNVPMLTHFQLEVPENIRGRLFGAFNTSVMLATPLGLWIYGLVLNHVNWVYIPIVSGFLMLGYTFYSNFNKDFKHFLKTLKD